MHVKQVLYPCATPQLLPFLMPLSGGHLALRWAPSPDVDTLGGNKFLSNKLESLPRRVGLLSPTREAEWGTYSTLH